VDGREKAAGREAGTKRMEEKKGMGELGSKQKNDESKLAMLLHGHCSVALSGTPKRTTDKKQKQMSTVKNQRREKRLRKSEWLTVRGDEK
jgi:hypothetical protein